MISFIKKNYGVFFYVCLVAIILIIIAQCIIEFPDWVSVIALLTLNIISWPVALGFWEENNIKTKTRAYFYADKFVWGLVGFTTLAPLYFLYDLIS